MALLSKEKHIENEIIRVMKAMGIERMPSRSEIESVTKSSSLSNLIMKNGGFYFWADKLKIKAKRSKTTNGIKYENKCIDYIKSLGMEAEPTSIKFPYDILVNDVTKIDVKMSNGYSCSKGYWYSFNLESTIPKCDIFVFYCTNNGEKEKTLIIPANVLKGIHQFSIGKKSIYDVYVDRWDYIEKHVSIMSDLFKDLR